MRSIYLKVNDFCNPLGHGTLPKRYFNECPHCCNVSSFINNLLAITSRQKAAISDLCQSTTTRDSKKEKLNNENNRTLLHAGTESHKIPTRYKKGKGLGTIGRRYLSSRYILML